MHEWALAESVVKTVMDNSLFKNKKVKVIIGQLQSIDEEVFDLAIREVMKQKDFIFDFVIETRKVEFKCLSCGNVFGLADIGINDEDEKENIHFIPEMVKAFGRCPKCKSIDFEIINGRGVSLSLDE